MNQRRSRIVTFGLILGLIGATLPVVAMGWMSWQIAQRSAFSVLDAYADAALQRASETFHSARLSLIKTGQSELMPCSEAHIAMMRDETINSPFVDEIGYFSDGILECTSWGPVNQLLERSHADFITVEGSPVTLRLKPAASFQGEMTAIYVNNYGALINPSTFLDISIQNEMGLALLTQQGQVVSERNSPAIRDIKKFISLEKNGFVDAAAFSVKNKDGLVAVVVDNNLKFGQPGTKELLMLVPVGVLIGGLLATFVYWNARQSLSPQAELALAIKRNEFFVQYQPIVDMKSGICVGAEALVRWRRADGDIVRPDQFIPLAEETGLIMALTDIVVDHVITDLGELLVNDRTLHIAINVSAADIHSGRIMDALDQKLKSSGVRAQQIWLEATERGFIDINSARSTLERARKAGHSVAIDDFGTGYSSLQYLQRLPLDALKIDKSFVDTICRDTATSTVTLHIIQIARELGLFTVAEGIETSAQADFLKREGVNFGQGWLYSKALPADAFVAYHHQNKITFGPASEVIQIAKSR